jgi:hypothetical protein
MLDRAAERHADGMKDGLIVKETIERRQQDASQSKAEKRR